MRLSRVWFIFSALYAVLVAVACFLRPIPGDYDRYNYEVVVRSWTQDWVDVYPLVKNESPILSGSAGFDSSDHMAQREPIFAIRPLYLELVETLHRLGFRYQTAISLISSSSFFALAILFVVWTRRPLLSALVISCPLTTQLAREGVPDALNALCILSSLFCLSALGRTTWGILLLLISVWIRTDSVLLCAAVLLWLTYEKKLELRYSAVLIGLAFASVKAVNYFSGNYGYAVLFRATFIGGKHPFLISSAPITVREYLTGLSQGLPSIIPQLAPWCLLGVVAWYLRSPLRNWMLPVASAALAHFVLFPSAEVRYLNWACVFAGLVFVEGVPKLAAVDVRKTDATSILSHTALSSTSSALQEGSAALASQYV